MLVGGSTVTCEQQDIDRYDRIVAICRAGRYDLGQTMVEYGYATAFRRYSDRYAGCPSQRRYFWPHLIWRSDIRRKFLDHRHYKIVCCRVLQ